jgi:organic radical activating enzyme
MFDYKFIEEVKELQKKTSKLYIYGDGFVGEIFLQILERNNICVDGFLVTKKSGKEEKYGLPVYEAKDFIHKENVGIILGLSDVSTREVMEYLKRENVDFSKVINGEKYYSEYRGITAIRSEPFLEVTTVIGCRVNCRFCPQNLLVGKYFERDKNRKRVMTVDDFRIILDNISQDCVVTFAGMAEPFLNPNCTRFLQMACESGRKVRLYTTLEGATEDDVDAIIHMPLQFVGLHIADQMKYAHIKLNEQYFRMLEKLVNAKKINNDTTFVNEITAQGDPDKKIVEILDGKFEILTAVHDRAGNLNDNKVVKREQKLVNEKFRCGYCGVDVNNHVVLPDGTLLLCQMDYGMKHVLGNLLEHTYDELRQGSTMNTIFEAMKGNRTCEVLCDTCVCAKKL